MGRAALSPAPRVRVGIVSWNTRELLGRCLDTLPAAAADLELEVVVVDNASTDGSAEAVAARSGVRLVRNAVNVGYAAAMNQALAAGPPVAALVALNPDTELAPGSLAALVDRLLADPGVGLVGPRLMNLDGTTQQSVYRFPSIRLSLLVAALPLHYQRGRLADRFWLEGRSDHHRRADVDWLIGAVHVMRPDALGRVAPYNERWFMYVEDLDLCWSLADRGWRCRLEGDIGVVHIGNAAGRQAWGDRRLDRSLVAAYDWYRLRRGAGPTLLWAVANAAGIIAHRLGGPTLRAHWSALQATLGRTAEDRSVRKSNH